jgi:alcohol dehydrogenase (cytochrome c)
MSTLPRGATSRRFRAFKEVLWRDLLVNLLLPNPAYNTTGCAHKHYYAPTEEAHTFSELDKSAQGVAPPVAQSVTYERLLNARSEPQNWLTYYGAYDAQRYSALDQINTSNVMSLKPAWIFQSGSMGFISAPATYAFEAAPIIVDGVMFVSGWDGYVWALNGESGQLLWKYKHAIPMDVPLCCGNVNRGVAVAQGKVFLATPNGHLVALDATNGRAVWDQVFVDVRAGESATVAPLVVKNMVVVGSSGGEYGVRGHIDAFDIQTGQRRWRHYNVPKPGESASETWGKKSWETGGGTAWITGSYDPQLNLLYWGVGNPGPDFDGDARPGNNLYTSGVVALNPDDGSLKWYYQWTPHDVWDYDGVNENILFDQNGRKLLAHFDKNGYLFILDRTDGKFVRATKFGRVTWGEIDSASGKLSVKLTPTAGGAHICPGPAGLKEWPHAAYSPKTGLLYTPYVEICATYKVMPQKFLESMPYWGGDVDVSGEHQHEGSGSMGHQHGGGGEQEQEPSAQPSPSGEHWGGVKAFDPATGREAWDQRSKFPMVSSVLATAGDLVFAGEPSGNFNAYDAHNGKVLWTFQSGSGIHSNPVTYSVHGKQYVAVPVGWGGWIKGFAPNMYGAPRGDALVVFALP